MLSGFLSIESLVCAGSLVGRGLVAGREGLHSVASRPDHLPVEPVPPGGRAWDAANPRGTSSAEWNAAKAPGKAAPPFELGFGEERWKCPFEFFLIDAQDVRRA